LKDLFQVDSLASVTKVAAMKLIDELLQSTAPAGPGNGATARHSVSQVNAYLACPLKYRFSMWTRSRDRGGSPPWPSAHPSTPPSSGSIGNGSLVES